MILEDFGRVCSRARRRAIVAVRPVEGVGTTKPVTASNGRSVLLPIAVSAALACCALVGPPGAAAKSSSPPVRISAVRATPHTVTHGGKIFFYVTVRGIVLDVRHMGRPNRVGHGHLQYYLDRIAPVAYRRMDVRHTFLAAVGTPDFIFRPAAAPVKILKGRHRILIALAQNNYVLYRAPVASVGIVVR